MQCPSGVETFAEKSIVKCPNREPRSQGIRWRISQSKLAFCASFSSQTQDIRVKRVDQRSTENREFSTGYPVSSHREC